MPECADCGVAIGRRSRWCKKCYRFHIGRPGVPKSEEHRAKIAAAHLGVPMRKYWGSLHKNWEGGDNRWRGFAWKTQRRKVLARDGHTCQACGATERLVVHHKKHKSETGGTWDNSVANLVTLCRTCHNQSHRARPRRFQCACAICGKGFLAGAPHANACSKGCKTKLNTAKHRRWLERRRAGGLLDGDG